MTHTIATSDTAAAQAVFADAPPSRLVMSASIRDLLRADARAAAPAVTGGLLIGSEERGRVRVSRAVPCPMVARETKEGRRSVIHPGAVANVSRTLKPTAQRIVGSYHGNIEGPLHLDSIGEGADEHPRGLIRVEVSSLRAWWDDPQGRPHPVTVEVIERNETVARRPVCPE